MSAHVGIPKTAYVGGGSLSVRTRINQIHYNAIPDDWSVRTLGEIGQCLIGLTYDPKNISVNGVLVLRSSNIDNNTLQFGDDIYVEMEIPERINVREGDLLICVRNGSRPLIGKCALIERQAAGMTFGAFMSVFRSNDSRFVSYCFQSDIVKRQIHKHLGATINQITNKSLNSFEIPYPGSRERTAIAEALSDVDGLLTALERLIDKKRAIKQAAMQQLLTGETRLPGFSGVWHPKRLGDTFKCLPTASNPRADLNEHGEVGYVHYGDIHSQTQPVLNCTLSDLPRISRAQVNSAVFLEDGDLVMVDASEDLEGVGKSIEIQGTAGRKTVAGLHTILCRDTGDDWAKGFKAYLQFNPMFRSDLMRVTAGTSVYAISRKQLADVRLPLPPPREQEAIVSVLSDMDTEIGRLEQRRDKTRSIKQGMMHALLTGRVRLIEPELASTEQFEAVASDRESVGA